IHVAVPAIPMTSRTLWRGGICAALVVAAALYLHDPPWVGGMSFGMRDWEQDEHGDRFRWTAGHASFFIPSDATAMVLPLRLFHQRNGDKVLVSIAVDDRWLTDVLLERALTWERPLLPLPRRSTGRRFRRIDLRVNRTVGVYNLGVEVGPLELTRD